MNKIFVLTPEDIAQFQANPAQKKKSRPAKKKSRPAKKPAPKCACDTCPMQLNHDALEQKALYHRNMSEYHKNMALYYTNMALSRDLLEKAQACMN